jgi:hypothetical protein
MIEIDDTIGICSFILTMEQSVIDPFKEDMYKQVSAWLLPVIEDVFNKPAFKEYRIKIDTLNINIGQIICSENSLKEVQPRLKVLLEEELNKRIAGNTDHGSSISHVISRKQADVCLLFEYLRDGFFTKRVPTTPDCLLEDILINDLQLFIKYLRASANIEIVLKRLVWQFDIRLLEKVIIEIGPSEPQFILDFITHVKTERILIDSQGNKPVESEATRYHRQILEFIFHYLLLENSIQFNRVEFVLSIIGRLSNHYNINFDSLVNTLLITIDNAGTSAQDNVKLRNILCEIQQKYCTQKRVPDKKKSSFDEIASLFLKKVHNGNASPEVIVLWDKLHFSDRDKIKNLLIKHCISTHIVRNLVRAFDGRRIRECIMVLCPLGFEFITQFTDIVEHELPVAVTYVNYQNDGTALFRQQALEFIMSYLLRRLDSSFSEKNFTQTILARIAGHYNIGFRFLLNAVITCIQDCTRTSPENFKSLLEILDELKKEQSTPSKESSGRLPLKLIGQIDIVSLFENMRSFLFDGVSGRETADMVVNENFKTVIEKIYHQRPDLLHCLFLEIKNDHSLIDKIMRYHSVNCIGIVNDYYKKISKVFDFKYESIFDEYYGESYASGSTTETFWDKYVRINYAAFEKENNSHYNPQMMSKGDLCHVEPRILFNYLRYFIVNPSLTSKHHISRKLLLELLQERHSDELVDEIRSIILYKPELHHYINHHSFIIDDVTIALIAGKRKGMRIETNVSELFRTIMKSLKLDYVSTIHLFVEGSDNCKCGGEEDFINNVRALCRSRALSGSYNQIELQESNTPIGGLNGEALKGASDSASIGQSCKNVNVTSAVREKNIGLNSFTAKKVVDCIRLNNEKPLLPYRKLNSAGTKEKEIYALFSYLEKPAFREIPAEIKMSTILNEMIVNSPELVINYLHNSKNTVCIAGNMAHILSENMFFRFLHCIDGYRGIIAYRYYSIIKNILSFKFTGDVLKIQTENLMKVVILQLLNADTHYTNGEKFYSNIISTFTSTLNITDRKEIVALINQDIEMKKIRSETSPEIYSNDIEKKSEKKMENDTSDLKQDNLRSIICSEKNNQEVFNSLIDQATLFDEIPIENAGMVIGAPYFEKLFKMLDLTDDKKFKNEESVQKAVRLLYYFAQNNTEPFEPDLVLNKLLCGLDINHMVFNDIAITNKEKEIVDSLTIAIINNWPVMKNTKPEGLRESFLQRKGILVKNDDEWQLKVEKRCFDMLINTLPWGFSMIKFPWMKGLLRVEWKME